MAENKGKNSAPDFGDEDEADVQAVEAKATPLVPPVDAPEEDVEEVAAKEAHADASEDETGPDVSFAREV